MDSENGAATQSSTTIDVKKASDFTYRYANNVQFEPTLWDLKVIFGQVDQSTSPASILQHTAITLAWPEVKTLAYFLRAHMAAHEAQVGKIALIPETINPPVSEAPAILSAYQRTKFELAYQAMAKVYEEFMRDNPEALRPAEVESNTKRENR